MDYLNNDLIRTDNGLPKFMIEVDGDKHYWSGRGKFAPKVFGELSKDEIQAEYAINDVEIGAMWKEKNI